MEVKKAQISKHFICGSPKSSSSTSSAFPAQIRCNSKFSLNWTYLRWSFCNKYYYKVKCYIKNESFYLETIKKFLRLEMSVCTCLQDLSYNCCITLSRYLSFKGGIPYLHFSIFFILFTSFMLVTRSL